MTKKPDKAIIIGLDAPIVPRLYRFCKEGHLPTINKLFLEQGVWARNCLVPLPTVTPPNWAAIATGAWPSTIEITDYNVHIPGDELDKLHQGLFSDDVHAETLYEAIARADKKSILLNYPSTWPPKVEDSIVVGGNGLTINSWARRIPLRVDKPPGGRLVLVGDPWPFTYSGTSLYSTQQYEGGVVIKFDEPDDWEGLPGSAGAVAAEMPLAFRGGLYKMEPVTWHILVTDGKAMFCESRDAATAMATLTEGQWSPPITREFETEKGRKKAVFRMKLLELSPDAQRFRLLMTNIAATDGWSHPASIAAEIESEGGLPGPGEAWGRHAGGGYAGGWFGLETLAEICNMENVFFADAATYLLKNKPWNLYMMHAHAPDRIYHNISNALNNPDPVARKPFEEVELEIYKGLDRMCAKIFGCADDGTVMALVSDHGAKPTTTLFNVNGVLQQAGFLSQDENRVIDWSKTRAYDAATTHIYINVMGRDPHGIVEPGEEYRKIQEEIINCLHDYTDPQSGKRPVVLALKKEDARIIGVHGDWVGDVIYGISGDFGGQHSPQLPTAQYGIGDLHGLFALSGANIRKGVELERTVWIQDLVPTICHLTGWPVPAQAEGAVIYQAMEDPNVR